MKKQKQFSILELEKAMQLDAAEIIAAQKKSRIIHKVKNIAASGRIVERAVREVFRNRLPAAYYVGEGHIVDENLKTSPQSDVIITESMNATVLFRDKDGTEWFPYESVYAIGEIRSSYYAVDSPVSGTKVPPITAYVENLARLKSELSRKVNENPMFSSLKDKFVFPPLNPLFSFMFIIESKKLDLDEVKSLYLTKNNLELPNVVCLLDRGLIINAASAPEGQFVNIVPGYEPVVGYSCSNANWRLVQFGEPEYREGANLAMLLFMLLKHLAECQLVPTNIYPYLKLMLRSSEQKNLT